MFRFSPLLRGIEQRARHLHGLSLGALSLWESQDSTTSGFCHLTVTLLVARSALYSFAAVSSTSWAGKER